MAGEATSGLPYLEISADTLHKRQLLESYRESVEPIFDCRVGDGDGQPDVWLKAYNAGPLLIGQAHMSGARFDYARERARVARTGLDMVMVQIITEGSDVRLHDGEPCGTRPGDVCIEDLTRPFATRAEDCTNYNLVLPRAMLDLNDQALDGLHGLVLKSGTLAAELLAAHVTTLWRWSHRIPLAEAPGVAHGTISLLAGLTAPIAEQEAHRAAVVSALVLRVRRHVEQHLASPDLTPDSIAKAFGVSRASLYRLCAPLGGVTQYIRTRRLHRAFGDLADPTFVHKTVAEIAYGWGFADWSSFSRAFRAEFDVTPSEVREWAAAGAAVALLARRAKARPHLPHWLKGLEEAPVQSASAPGRSG